MGFVCVRVCAHVMHRTNTRDAGDTGTRRARQWCARSIIPYYTIRFRAGRTCNSRLSTSFVERRAKSVCLHRLAAAMHSALVSAIVSSTVRWLHLNCEWFTDNVPHEFFAPKTFCELVNFEVGTLLVISLSPNWTVYILFNLGPCAICVSKWTFRVIFRKTDFWKLFRRDIFSTSWRFYLTEHFWSQYIWKSESENWRKILTDSN